MTRSQIISALKENEKPFGLMPEEMKHAMVCDIKKSDIEYYGGPAWHIKDEDGSNGGFLHHTTYRLCPDYEDKPALVKCKITTNMDNWRVFVLDDREHVLGDAFDIPGFSGFLFEGGEVDVTPVLFEVPECEGLFSRTTLDNLESGASFPIDATYVLYRSV